MKSSLFLGGNYRLLPKYGIRRLCRSLSSRNASPEIVTEVVLGAENRKKCVEKLGRMPLIRVKEGEIPKNQAAVLIPLCIVEKRLAILYMLRSAHMSKNAGQVSFPGGMKDDTDKDLVETAIREAHEEMGIDKNVVDVWGKGRFIGTWDKSVAVMPVLGYLGEIEVEKLNINPREVEKAFAVPLEEFCDPKNCRYTKYLRGYCMPVYLYQDFHIWGLTAMITHIVLSALLQDKYTRNTGNVFGFFKRVK